jgi:hypothetical protein
MGDADVDTLKSILSANREWAEWSNIVVIGGLAVEMIVLWLFSHGWRESISFSVAVLVIAVGVYGEYHFGGRSSDAAAKLQDISDLKVETARDRAAKAELELAKLKTPRKLNNEQNVIAALRPHAGKKFWIITERNDQDLGSEQMLLSAQISRIFSTAGWVKNSHLSADQSLEEKEFAPVSDRGCNLATAGDAKSLALRELVFESLKSSDLECFQNVAPGFLPESVVIEIGLR